MGMNVYPAFKFLSCLKVSKNDEKLPETMSTLDDPALQKQTKTKNNIQNNTYILDCSISLTFGTKY